MATRNYWYGPSASRIAKLWLVSADDCVGLLPSLLRGTAVQPAADDCLGLLPSLQRGIAVLPLVDAHSPIRHVKMECCN